MLWKYPTIFGLPNHQAKKMMIHQYNVVVYDISKIEILVCMFQWWGLNSVKVFM
jgi:hypothetical protein